MRAVSSVPNPEIRGISLCIRCQQTVCRAQLFVFNALRCLMNEIECACGMGWPVISERVCPISGFRPQLAELESVQLEPGTTDFGRRRA